VQRLSDIKAMLAERGLRPRRRFGQNFLHDHNLLRRLVDASGAGEGDLVLEVGPGTGTLTETLLERGCEVIAVELDRDLADLVADRVGDQITLIRGDCLGGSRSLASPVVEAIGGRPFSLVANLPYQAASPLMSELLLHHPNCAGQWITIQQEVADRLTAMPGEPAWGPLGVIVRSMADVQQIASLPPSCFWPAPKVRSAMVAVVPHSDRGEDPAGFAAFVTRLFTTRRKQLGGVLGREVVQSVGVDPQWRCERLDIETLKRLYKAV
jgi:16S rRNA (adenine1518-N6/adenine1519-N6)-dimethyltransferase